MIWRTTLQTSNDPSESLSSTANDQFWTAVIIGLFACAAYQDGNLWSSGLCAGVSGSIFARIVEEKLRKD